MAVEVKTNVLENCHTPELCVSEESADTPADPVLPTIGCWVFGQDVVIAVKNEGVAAPMKYHEHTLRDIASEQMATAIFGKRG